MAENTTSTKDQAEATRTLAVQVTEDVHRNLKVIAAATGTSIKDLVSGALGSVVSKNKPLLDAVKAARASK